jgi:hypothetical protein
VPTSSGDRLGEPPTILIEAGVWHRSAVPHFLRSPVSSSSWPGATDVLAARPLSIIIVGQNITATTSNKRAEVTYSDATSILPEAREIQEHLRAQDDKLIAALQVALARSDVTGTRRRSPPGTREVTTSRDLGAPAGGDTTFVTCPR